MSSLFFDNQPSQNSYPEEELEPLWAIDLEDEDEVKRWGQRAFDLLNNYYESRDFMIYESIARYKGIYLQYEPVVGGARLIGERRKSNKEFPKIITNHLKSLVDNKVKMQVKYKPDVDLIPDSYGDYRDKLDCECAKKFLKSVHDFNHDDNLWPRFARRAILTGQSFVVPYWDDCVGQKDGKKTKSITLKRKNGENFTSESPIYMGEIRHRFPLTQFVRLFPSQDVEGCQGVMILSFPLTWELRAKYPDLQDEINSTREISYYDYNLCMNVPLPNRTLRMDFYIRSNDIIPDGLFFSMTPTTILEQPQDNPIPINDDAKGSMEFGDLPIIRLTDTDIDGDVNGYPSTLDIQHQQHVYDKLKTHMIMNVAYFCNPKWIAQKNSVQFKALETIPGLVIEHTGTIEPKLAVYNAITQDQFQLLALTLKDMENTFGIASATRGSPPPGTRATSQLYFYDEQEAEMNMPFKRKLDHAIEGVSTLDLALMAKYYTEGSKKRIINILGEDKRWQAEALDVSSLKRQYTVRVKASSNMPDSKYARLNALFELYSMNPNQATWDQLCEMIDFGQQEKLIDSAKAAVMSAEKENEQMQDGQDVKEPEPWEKQIDHWNVHIKLMQMPEFKSQDEAIKKRVIEHIGAHEVIMLGIGLTNPGYQQTLVQLGQFPMVAPVPPVNPQAQTMQYPQQPPPQNPVGAPRQAKGPGVAGALALPEEDQTQLATAGNRK